MALDGQDSIPIALARLESKLDHLLGRQDSIGKQIDEVEVRLREVERDATTLKQAYESRLPWTAVVSALCAALAFGFVIAERLFDVAP